MFILVISARGSIVENWQRNPFPACHIIRQRNWFPVATQFSNESWFIVGHTIRHWKLVHYRLHNSTVKAGSLQATQFSSENCSLQASHNLAAKHQKEKKRKEGKLKPKMTRQWQSLAVDFWIGRVTVFGCRFLNRQQHSLRLSISESTAT